MDAAFFCIVRSFFTEEHSVFNLTILTQFNDSVELMSKLSGSKNLYRGVEEDSERFDEFWLLNFKF